MTKEEKRKEYMKQYYQANRERIREQQKQYKQDNAEYYKQYYKEYYKQYYQENTEQIKEYQKQYYQDNAERFKEQQKQYRKENAEYYKQYYKEYNKQYLQTPIGRALNLLRGYNQADRKHNRGKGDLTAKWIVERIFSQPCNYCGKEGWKVIGCDRIDNSKPHTMDNVVPCCAECNIKRGNKTYEEFLADN